MELVKHKTNKKQAREQEILSKAHTYGVESKEMKAILIIITQNCVCKHLCLQVLYVKTVYNSGYVSVFAFLL